MFCRLLLRAETMAGLCREMGREEQRGLGGLGTLGDNTHTHTDTHTCALILCPFCRCRLLPMRVSLTAAFGSADISLSRAAAASPPRFPASHPFSGREQPELDLPWVSSCAFPRQFPLCKCRGSPGGEGCGRRGWGRGRGGPDGASPGGSGRSPIPSSVRALPSTGPLPDNPSLTGNQPLVRDPLPPWFPAPARSFPGPTPAPVRS